MPPKHDHTEFPITLDRLCPGVFVRFEEEDAAKAPAKVRGGFKVANQSQIEALRRLGVTTVIAVLEKSDSFPLPADEEASAPENPTDDSPEATPQSPPETPEPAPEPAITKPRMKTPVSRELLALKEETLARNRERRARFKQCEQEYDASAARVAQIIRRVSGRSEEAGREAVALVKGLAEVFQAGQDVLVNLINSKPTEDLKHYHALNVTVLALMVGRGLKLSGETMRALGMAALFHDVGKGRMPVSQLTGGQMGMGHAVDRHYQQHPVAGAKIVQDVPLTPPAAVAAILQHHEAMDGSGFPKGLKGSAISPLARIIHICDAYDKLCNVGPSAPSGASVLMAAQLDSEPLTPHEAMKHLYNRMKRSLDPQALEVFIRTLGVYPPGTVVQLSNGMTGMVVNVSPDSAARPGVMVHHSEIPKKEALIIDLRVETSIQVEKTLRVEQLSREVFRYLSPSKHVGYSADAASAG